MIEEESTHEQFATASRTIVCFLFIFKNGQENCVNNYCFGPLDENCIIIRILHL